MDTESINGSGQSDQAGIGGEFETQDLISQASALESTVSIDIANDSDSWIESTVYHYTHTGWTLIERTETQLIFGRE